MSKRVKKITDAEKKRILTAADTWFRTDVVPKHIRNIKKLKDADEFNINPFTVRYLAHLIGSKADVKGVAEALVLPRAITTSINTTFGSSLQKFISAQFNAPGSKTLGLDIEYTDKIDGEQKYCQVKAGPNTINKDGSRKIVAAFQEAQRTAKQNFNRIPIDDFVVGVCYGTPAELSNHYQWIENQGYSVIVGQEFWERLTGDKNFYDDFIEVVQKASLKVDVRKVLESTSKELAKHPDIQKLV